MEIIGYKCFHKGLMNHYGKKFSVGKIYIVPGIIKFGVNGNGYHICKNIEDTFRYYNCFTEDIDVCIVRGSGDFVQYSDEYYGYYDMFSVQKLEILKQLTRDEIIHEGLNLGDLRVERFVSTYKLTSDEIILFKEHYQKSISVLKAIAYYQEGQREVYNSKVKLLK